MLTACPWRAFLAKAGLFLLLLAPLADAQEKQAFPVPSPNDPAQSPVVWKFDARGAGLKPQAGTLKGWGGKAPNGKVLGTNNYYLELEGRPLPLALGEIHPQRYPREYWEEAILEMKAAGLNGISVYIFWNQIEKRPGEFDFTGNNDIRRFVELCASHGLYVWLRIGPFNNAEFLLGGLPPWLYGMPLTERSNQSLYLELVGRYFSRLGEQLRGLNWSEGGPIIGTQVENELGVAGVEWERVFPLYVNNSGFTGLKDQAYADHYLHLKKMAEQGGIRAPFFSCTGWGLNETKPIPWQEIFPTELGYMGGYYYHKNTDKNWLTLFDNSTHILKPFWGKCPVGLAEIGTGLSMTPLMIGKGELPPEVSSAATLTRFGSMPTIMAGYYMFHGGSNPFDAGYGWTTKDLKQFPQVSYDFQAPIGEFGNWRPSLFQLRPFNHFLVNYGTDLARTEVRHPADPVLKSDDRRLRSVVRMDGNSGFVFFNNYGCRVDLPVQPDTHFEIRTDGGVLTLPREVRLDIPGKAMGVLPVNLQLGGGAVLVSATAQPVCQFEHDGRKFHVFSQLGKIPCEFVLAKGTTVESLGAGVHEGGGKQDDDARVFVASPGHEAAFNLRAPDGTLLTLLLLPQQEARNLAIFHRGEGTLLAMSSDPVIFDGKQLKVTGEKPQSEVLIFPPLSNKGTMDGVFQKVSLTSTPHTPEAKIEKFAPNKWLLKMPESAFEGLNDIWLDMTYAGQACRIFDAATGLMVADQFNLGTPWRVGLKRFRSQLNGKGLWIRAEPDSAAVTLAGIPEVVTGIAGEQKPQPGVKSQITGMDFVPEYQSTFLIQK